MVQQKLIYIIIFLMGGIFGVVIDKQPCPEPLGLETCEKLFIGHNYMETKHEDDTVSI